MTTSDNIELKFENTLRNSIDNNDIAKTLLLINFGIKIIYDDITHILKYPNMVKLLAENDMMTPFAYSIALGYYPGDGNLELTKIITTKFKFDQNLLDAASCLASEKGHIEIVKYLHDTFIIDMDMAFANAVKIGNIDIVTYFIDKGVDVNCLDGIAFLNSVEHNHVDITEILIEKGAHIHKKALQLSASKGYYVMTELLLNNGADVNSDNNEALRLAIENNNIHTTEILLSRGAIVSFYYVTNNIRMIELLHKSKLQDNDLKRKLESYECDIQKLQEENNALKKKLNDIKTIIAK